MRIAILIVFLIATNCYATDITSTSSLGTATSSDSILAVDASEAPGEKMKRILFNGNSGSFLSGAGTWVSLTTNTDAQTLSYAEPALTISGGNSVDIEFTDQLTFHADGGGAAITTGVKTCYPVEYAATIESVRVMCDQSGSIVVDIWKDIAANYPPTDADSITAAAPPTVTTDDYSLDSTLTGWTTAITAGDILCYNVDSATTVEWCTVTLKVTK